MEILRMERISHSIMVLPMKSCTRVTDIIRQIPTQKPNTGMFD